MSNMDHKNVGDSVNYNLTEMEASRMTGKHIAALVNFYQLRHARLDADGKFGPETRRVLEGEYADLWVPPAPPKPDLSKIAPFLSCPLPLLKAGPLNPQARKPVITSQFRKPDRPDHDGVDFFYRWEPGDQPAFVGDGGCEGKDLNGNPKWVVPYGNWAQAAADGVIQMSGPSDTGVRVWINHGNGLRSGYFHLSGTDWQPGMRIMKGAAIGPVGHNPKDQDGRHLHFEVSPVEKYEPLDPEKYLLKW